MTSLQPQPTGKGDESCGPMVTNYGLLVLLLPAAVGSFSFAAIQQAIKNPARGGAAMSLADTFILAILFYLISDQLCQVISAGNDRNSIKKSL